MAGVMIAAPKSGSGKTMIPAVFLSCLTGEDGTRPPLNAALITLTACSTTRCWDWKAGTWTAFLRNRTICVRKFPT